MHTTSRLMPSRSAIAVALATLLVSAMPAAARDASARPSAPPAPSAPRGTEIGTVKGDCVATDCLELAMNANGSVSSVTEGARAIPMNGKKGGFSIRMAGNQPNLIKNPGFESAVSTTTDVNNWRFPTSGTTPPTRVADGDAGHAGSWAARVLISGTINKTSAIAYQTVAVSPSTNYTIAGWFKTTDIKPNSTETTAPLTYRADLAPVAIRIEQLNSSNTVQRTNWVYAYTGTAGWHQNATGVKTISTATKIRLAIGVRSGRGTVLFDDISLKRLLAPAATPMVVTATQPGGGNNPIELDGTVSGQPLELEASISSTAKGIEIAGGVTNTSATGSIATDRAFQLTFTLPINATGWSYGDTPRVARVITSTGVYFFENNLNSPTARYPWATVYDASSGLNLGAPLTKPRAYGLKYNSKGLAITFDLGASKSATALNARASFRIQLFRSDETYKQGSAWGFRGAIAKYYAQNAASFARKPAITSAREGVPYYQPPIVPVDADGLTYANANNMHLGLNVLTLNNLFQGDYVDWNEQGIEEDKPINAYTAAYTHHWGHFQAACPDGGQAPTDCPTRTYAQVIAKITSDSTMECDPGETLAAAACRSQRAEAIAALESSAKDMNGRFRYDISDNNRDYRIRQIPGLDLGTSVEWFEAVRDHQMAKAKEYVEEAPDAGVDGDPELDAIYVDSTSGMRAVWGDVDDYDRAHWAVLPEPATLTFSYHSGRAVLQSFFANYLQLEKAATWAAANNVFLVLDTNGKEQTPGGILATDMADWLLMENSLRDLEQPPPGVTPDSFGLLKRTLASQRPITSVDPKLTNSTFPFGPADTGTTALATDSVTARVNESLFYGIWPGPDKWNFNSRTPPWYDNPAYSTLYTKYGNLLERLADAGWEPITMARSSNANVWLERYGSTVEDDLHIAIRNSTASSQTATVTVKFQDGSAGASPDEVVRNATLSGVTNNGTTGTFTVTVPAGVTLLVVYQN